MRGRTMKRSTSSAGIALGGITLAVSAGLGTAGQASADGSVCASTCAAAVNFQSYGEHFTVHDYAADGHSAVGLLEYWSGGAWHAYPYVWNTNGLSGNPVTVNYSIAEGTPVAYLACLGESGTGSIFDCGAWHYDTA